MKKTKWKPIKEADKRIGVWYLGRWKNLDETIRPIQWIRKRKAWCDCPDGDAFYDEGQPTEFIEIPS